MYIKIIGLLSHEDCKSTSHTSSTSTKKDCCMPISRASYLYFHETDFCRPTSDTPYAATDNRLPYIIINIYAYFSYFLCFCKKDCRKRTFLRQTEV